MAYIGCTTKEKLLEDIENEGFAYAILHYDDYSNIPDEQFQELYRNYKAADKALRDHLGIPEGE